MRKLRKMEKSFNYVNRKFTRLNDFLLDKGVKFGIFFPGFSVLEMMSYIEDGENPSDDTPNWYSDSLEYLLGCGSSSVEEFKVLYNDAYISTKRFFDRLSVFMGD